MRCHFLGVLASVLLVLGPAAPAVTFHPLSIENLAREAQVVLHGKVLSKTVQRDAAGRIYTRVEVEVIDLWKGAVPGNPCVIVHAGGVLGDEQSAASGQARYEVGEEMVAFLVRNDRGEAVTLGLMQGKFRVWKDAVTAAKLAASPFHRFSDRSTARVRVQSAGQDGAGAAPLSLEELRDRVREVGR
jgi:hypothetical protein